MGVKTRKKIIAMTIGAIIFPSNSPSLIQYLFNGIKIFDSVRPNIKKTTENINDQILKSPLYINGQSPINKKTIKNNNPKLLTELFDFI